MAIQKITTDIIEDNAVTGSKISVGTPAAGDILYYNGTDYVKLAKGTDGEVLKLESGLPVWGASSGGSPSSGGGGPSDAFIISGNRGATGTNQIFNYAFASSTESVWGTCEDDGAGGASSGCSHSTATDGYYTTGTIPNPVTPSSPTFRTTIERYSYSSQGNAVDIGDTGQHKTVAGGISSSTDAYVLGGTGFNITGHSSNGHKFAFATGSSSGSAISLEIGKANMGTHQDSTHGYTFGGVSGGGNNPVVTAVATVCRFAFANDTTREDIDSMAENSAGHATVGNNTTCFNAGGNSASNQGNTVNYTRIDSYQLASGATQADHGDLATYVTGGYGASTNTTGIIVGGNDTVSYVTHKQEFAYASNTTATQLTALTSTAGGGGHGQVPPTF